MGGAAKVRLAKRVMRIETRILKVWISGFLTWIGMTFDVGKVVEGDVIGWLPHGEKASTTLSLYLVGYQIFQNLTFILSYYV